MRRLIERLPLLLSFAFVLAVLAQLASAEQPALLAASVTVALLALSVGSRRLAVLIRARTLHVGHRARRHRAALERIPEPSHPDTAGRIRSRAPGRIFAAA